MRITVTVVFSIVVFAAHAQKLPKVQNTSVRAPENIKIDGELTEWNGQFQAYNRGNHIYYTVSNDDNNLYLTAHMDDIVGSGKIFKGELTFTIVPSTKKADKLSITFPAIPKRRTTEIEQIGDGPLVYKILKSDTVGNKLKIDSLISLSNNLIQKVYSQIQVTGIPGINDSLVSVYNTQGIKVGASVDRRMRYNYELAIPLRYLNAIINNSKSFKYNIKLNANSTVEAKGFQSFAPPMLNVTPQSDPDGLFLNYTTDFSGEYPLAKKR